MSSNDKSKFIFTADDFGVVPAINEGIIQAASEELINSVATFTNYDGFDKAVNQLLTANPTVQVGVHLTISSGKPITSPEFFLDHDKQFYNYKKLTRPNQNERLEVKAQLHKELKAQIDRLFDVLPDRKVRHLSVHYNSLYFIPEYFEVLVEVANSYRPRIPIRAVAARPSLKHDFFVAQMMFTIAWWNLSKISDIEEVEKFSENIENYVNYMKNPPLSPDLFHSVFFGPPGIVRIRKRGIKKAAARKINNLLKAYKLLTKEQSCEFVLHLIDDNVKKLNEYKSSLKAIDYQGINPRYFDSRMAELRSLRNLKRHKKHSDFYPLVNWPIS